MSGRRADMLDIREILRRVRLGESDRAIVKGLGVSRKTVRKYRQWAEQAGLPAGELPPAEQLSALLQASLPEVPPPQAPSAVEPYRAWWCAGASRAWSARRSGNGCAATMASKVATARSGGSSAAWKPPRPRSPYASKSNRAKKRQVDFGYVGLLLDPATGRRRKAWAFVMTLSWSRHMYVEFVFDQTVETWVRLHQHAFAFFGAVPRRIVLDNLKAAIVKACFEDPVVQRSYQELAEHYGFLLAPCRVRMPEHKGKVENGVHYVQRNLLAARTSRTSSDRQSGRAGPGSSRWPASASTARPGKSRWCASRKPSRPRCCRYPANPTIWPSGSRSPVGRDCYVNFEKSYYSAPYRLVGQQVWVRGGLTSVRIYANHQVEALHPRAKQPGERYTVLDHLPPEKVAGLTTTREPVRCGRPKSAPVPPRSSPACWPRSRSTACHGEAPAVGEKYGALRLERACRRALQFEE